MANYGSDDDDTNSSEESEEDSDAEIESRMRKKKKSFERLEVDIVANCESLEKDFEHREERWKSGMVAVNTTQGNLTACWVFLSGDSYLGAPFVIAFFVFPSKSPLPSLFSKSKEIKKPLYIMEKMKTVHSSPKIKSKISLDG